MRRTSRASWEAELPSRLRDFPLSAELHLKFLGFRLDVRTNSLRVASRLASYFGGYLVAPGTAAPDRLLLAVQTRPDYDAASMQVWQRATSGRPPKESYYDRGGKRYILKNRTGVLIELAPEYAAIVGDVERYVNQVVNLAGTLFGLSLVERGYAMVHASAVVRADSDEATIFLGNSGSGKSSLALQLIERGGFDYVSNDRVLLKTRRSGVEVVGLPKKPRVNPGTLLASDALMRLLPASKRPMYEGMAPSELWGVEDKHDVDVGEVLGARERLSGQLAQAYSLEWKPGGDGLQTAPLSADDALQALRNTAKDFGPFDPQRGERDAEREYGRIARAVAFTRVTGASDPRRLARELGKP